MEYPPNRRKVDDSCAFANTPQIQRGDREDQMAAAPISRQSIKARSGALSSRKRNRTKSTEDNRIEDVEPIKKRLTMLLEEPEVQMLMRADRVDVHQLMAELNAVSLQLQSTPKASPETREVSKKRSADSHYRPGVGIMLLNRQGQVFVARRIDVSHDAWQMPQGGINRGEAPRRAALRELREEIGTNNAEIVAESDGWFYYDVPVEIAQAKWGEKWRGQRQKWFVMIFKGRDADINLETEHPEFNAWKWVSVPELSALAVSFKRQLYVDVMGEFATIFRD
jgi:putative (di)nucleoside polyphosphate hydrolase